MGQYWPAPTFSLTQRAITTRQAGNRLRTTSRCHCSEKRATTSSCFPYSKPEGASPARHTNHTANARKDRAWEISALGVKSHTGFPNQGVQQGVSGHDHRHHPQIPPGRSRQLRSLRGPNGVRSADPRPRGQLRLQERPHTRTIGGTFEFTFKLPKPQNSGGRPPSKRKNRRSSKKAPARIAKTKKAAKPGKDRRTYQDRKGYQRASDAKQRTERIELGLCVSCSNTAIAGQTRCPSCAEKHRQGNRLRNSRQTSPSTGRTIAKSGKEV